VPERADGITLTFAEALHLSKQLVGGIPGAEDEGATASVAAPLKKHSKREH